MKNETENTAAGSTPAANLKFVGRREFDRHKRKVVNPNDPVESISISGRIIALPAAETQKANRMFYHEDAAEIANAFPHLYRMIQPKIS